MATLSISLLGEFSIVVDGEAITTLTSNKALMLLAYLVMEPRQHQRSEVAGLLWPDHAERAARTNLRHVLRVLRQSLPSVDGAPDFFLAGQQTLHLNPEVDVAVDAWRFRELLTRCADCDHAAPDRCPSCMARYSEAAALYRGDLLADRKVDESDLFEEWAVIQREGLHRQALDLFFWLTTYHETQNDNEQALRYARRQLELEPWREEAHRQLMRILARSGQRTAALAQYTQCKTILAEELAVEPDSETTTLYEQIRAGQFPIRPEKPISNQPIRTEINVARPPVSKAQDWGEAPLLTRFYGRENEQSRLTQWLLGERCRVIAILGMGGMGKTSLMAAVAKAAGEQFDLVFWRSLLNAPSLAELLPPLLQRLIPSGEVQIPTAYHEQMTLLFTQLSIQRSLVILDNWESLLEPGGAGHYRAGYEAYGQLLQRFVHSDHQSCLMLTSRERPEKLGQMEDDRLPVRALRLNGLALEAGCELLGRRGHDPDVAQVHTLVTHYSGNPLALKLVARTIEELFDGDISAFLEDDAPIFDDIRAVLDEQSSRLTPLEQELLLWLAIEREATATKTLTQNLVRKPSQRELIEALRALERRSLLERNEQGFLLQSVVTEYLTDCLIEQACREITDASAPFPTLLLNRHALSKAQAVEYVRQSQLRQIVQPIINYLLGRVGEQWLVARLLELRTALQTESAGGVANVPGYLGGNLLNLLIELNADLTGQDFSHLALWQAHLRGVIAPNLDLTGADLTGAAFTYSFGALVEALVQVDDELMICGTRGEEACIWRARDGTLLHAIHRPGINPTNTMIVYGDGRTAMLADADHTLYLVDMADKVVRHTLVGHDHFIWRPRFSHGGKWLATSDAGGVICLWDVATGERLWRVQGHATPIPALAFAPDDRLLASGSVDGVVALWELPTGTLVHRIQAHTDETTALQFVLGGTVLASGSHDQTIGLWDVASGAVRGRLHGHTNLVRMLATDGAGSILVSGGADNFMLVWDMQTGEIRHRLTGFRSAIAHVVCWRNGQRFASADNNEIINIWDLQSGRRIHQFPMYRNGVQVLTFAPDGKRLASGSGNGVIYLWDVSTPANPQLIRPLYGHQYLIRSLAFCADGTLLASGDEGGELRLWSVADGASRLLTTRQQGIMALAFSPDSQTLVSGNRAAMLDLWHVASGRHQGQLRGHTNRVMACVFHPDGRHLASGSSDHTICLWDVEQGALLHVLDGHTNFINDLCYTPDGQSLLSTGFDELTLRWDAGTGQLQERWPKPDAVYLALSIAPSGEVVAAGSRDQTVHLLELATGRLLRQLRDHSSYVEDVCFSPVAMDGVQLLASSSQDETIKLWAIETEPTADGTKIADVTCLATLRAPGPYAGMSIRDVTGISDAQIASLRALGAVE